MNTFPNYTPLESLLLFQSLRADGVDNINFRNISEQLKAVSLVRNAPSYSDDRLGPDALRELYLRLVKEEVRLDCERQAEVDGEHNGSQPGNVSSPTRKRKLASPTYVPSVQEAAQHSHLIPRLVTRLYARYRESTVAQIRDFEHRYDLLSRSNDARKSNVPASGIDVVMPASANGRVAENGQQSSAPTAISSKDLPRDTLPLTSKIVPLSDHGLQGVGSTTSSERRPSPTAHPSSNNIRSPSLPGSPLDGQASITYQRSSQPPLVPALTNTNRPQPVASGAHSIGSGSPSPVSVVVPVAQGQANIPRPSPSSRPTPSLSGTPSLPQGPHRSPSGPQVHHPHHPSAHSQHFHQHVRSPLVPAAASERAPTATYGTPVGAHNHQQYAQPDPRISYTPQGRHVPLVAPPYPAQSPHPGGYQLQPFYLDSPGQQQQGHPRGHTAQVGRSNQMSQQPARPAQTPTTQLSYGSATGPRPLPRPQLIHDIVAALATPPRSQTRPLWKSSRSAPPHNTPEAPPRPMIEPLSPTLGRAKSPIGLSRAPRSRQSRASRDVVDENTGDRRSRDRSSYSAASSTTHGTVHTRARSRSIKTNSDPGDRVHGRRGIKAESPVLSKDAGISEEALSTSRGRGRKRRGTLGSSVQTSPHKRKRPRSSSTTADDASEDMRSPLPQPQTVAASRNFTKLSATLMNDINSHKHASYFAGPVRDRDAEGYSDIIKQPQHLKSIRAAITAGTRAVAAAVQAMESPGDTPSASVSLRAGDVTTSVELERSAELMPPKGIVDGAQLEKEIMRMFANAVMFNPGEDGLVADAREMFEDVEEKIRVWRGAERVPGGDDEDDSKGKRRKA